MLRRTFLRGMLGLTGAGLGLGAYAGAIEPGWRLRVQRWDVQPAAWPRGFQLRIAVVTDLHAGAPLTPEGRIERIVATANAEKPDLVALLGDHRASHRFVTRAVPLEAVAERLADLSAPLGVHHVLGNHDWWDDRGAQARGAGPTLSHAVFDRAGLRPMENDALRLEKNGQPFWLLGLGDQIAFHYGLRRQLGGPPRHHAPALDPRSGVDDLAGTLAQVTDDAPAILLAHEPDIFPHVPARVSLTLSGHTHGGQVRLFGHSPIVPSRYGDRYAYGVITEPQGTLVVSAGLGCSVLPVRFGAPPEITIINLA